MAQAALPASQLKLEPSLLDVSQGCSPATVAQTDPSSSHSAAVELDSATLETGHTRLLPLREAVGVAPFSHSGSEPSLQEKVPSVPRTGVWPPSQCAGWTEAEVGVLVWEVFLAGACLA